MSFLRAIICLDGEPPSRGTFRKSLSNHDCIIAADGGANWLDDYGVKPDILIGDLDGVRKKVRAKLSADEVVLKEDQYSTDLEKAFAWAIEKKIKNIIVMAAAGKRIDHTLSNFALLWSFHQKINVQITHDDWTAFLLPNQKASFDTHKGMTVSLIPYSNCSGITLQGFEYLLKNATMNLGEVGVSNVALGKKVRIEIKKGHMLAVFLKKKS